MMLSINCFTLLHLSEWAMPACLVLNPITIYSYDFHFNCMMVGQASDFNFGSDVKL